MLRPVWLIHRTGREEEDGGGRTRGGSRGGQFREREGEQKRKGGTSLLSVKTWEEQGGWGEFGQDHGLEDED